MPGIEGISARKSRRDEDHNRQTMVFGAGIEGVPGSERSGRLLAVSRWQAPASAFGGIR